MCISLCTYALYVHVCLHICVHICACVWVCAYVCLTCLCMYDCAPISVYMYVCACVSICLCMCACASMCHCMSLCRTSKTPTPLSTCCSSLPNAWHMLGAVREQTDLGPLLHLNVHYIGQNGFRSMPPKHTKSHQWGRVLARLPPWHTHWWIACRNFLWCFLTLAWSIFFSSFVCL